MNFWLGWTVHIFSTHQNVVSRNLSQKKDPSHIHAHTHAPRRTHERRTRRMCTITQCVRHTPTSAGRPPVPVTRLTRSRRSRRRRLRFRTHSINTLAHVHAHARSDAHTARADEHNVHVHDTKPAKASLPKSHSRAHLLLHLPLVSPRVLLRLLSRSNEQSMEQSKDIAPPIPISIAIDTCTRQLWASLLENACV